MQLAAKRCPKTSKCIDAVFTPTRQHDSAMVETFGTALANKEKAKFLQLLIAGAIPWISVINGDDLMRIRKERPSFKVRVQHF